MRLGRISRCVEISIVLAGAAMLGIAGLQLLGPAAFQLHPNWFLSQQTVSTSKTGSQFAVPIAPAPALVATRSVNLLLAGKIEIPRLGVSVFVVEGDDARSLALAPGHVPGTSPLGGNGNAVVAGHREMAFRALRNVRIGDEIDVYAAQAQAYRVKSVRVVKPDDISILSKGKHPMLTLITCYPFYYVGSAPKRFIVQATMTNH